MNQPYRIVIEEPELNHYAEVVDRSKILILDPIFQRDYDPCMDLPDGMSKGSGPARNFAWEHSVSEGHAWHWCLDDNLREFYRLNRNQVIRVGDGKCFQVMEDFVLRYENIAIAGPQYFMFAPRKKKWPAFSLNTRIYSCCMIRNDLPFRWRARYNEDTDLSLRVLKAGWCTVQFYAFLQAKMPTMKMGGGNTDELYKHGTKEKSEMIARLHPDVARVTWRFGRPHHLVNYRKFQKNVRLVRRKGLEIPRGIDDYGMKIVKRVAP